MSSKGIKRRKLRGENKMVYIDTCCGEAGSYSSRSFKSGLERDFRRGGRSYEKPKSTAPAKTKASAKIITKLLTAMAAHRERQREEDDLFNVNIRGLVNTFGMGA